MQIRTGYASCPFRNTPPCGDHWLNLDMGNGQRLMLADGMGHGEAAHRIVISLAEHLKWLCNGSRPMPNLETCLEQLHQLLLMQINGAQAAVALVDIDTKQKVLQVAIVGNVQVHYFTPETNLRFPSMHGMVGGRFPRHLQRTSTCLESGSLLALFSDGLDSTAACQELSSLHAHSTVHGLRIQSEAETMLRRHSMLSDDASCALLWFE